jgi:hypothetical protein
MSLFTNNFDHHLNRKVADAELSPPTNMWERIEAQLPKEKKRIPWLPLGITSGALLLIGGLSWYLISQNHNNNVVQSSQSAGQLTSSQSASIVKDNSNAKNDNSKENIVKEDNSHLHTKNIQDQSSSKSYSSAKKSSVVSENDEEEKSISAGFMKKNKNNNNQQHSNTNKLYKDDESTSSPNTLPSNVAITNTIISSEEIKQQQQQHTTQNTEVLSSKTVVLEEMHRELEQLLDVKIPEIETPTTAAGIEDVSKSALKKLENLKQFAGYNVKRGFHIGPYMAITYNWLSRQTESPENRNQLSSTFQLNKMYGVSTGYDFSDRWGVLTEFAYAEQGIQYQDINAIPYTLKINYFKVPVMMKYKIMFLNEYNSKPIILNLLFGGHYSHMQQCKMYIDGKASSFDQKVNNNEWGLMSGMDFDIYLNKHIYFTSGIRGGFGANTKGFPRMKGSDGNSPVSLQLGVYTKLNFRLPLKIK